MEAPPTRRVRRFKMRFGGHRLAGGDNNASVLPLHSSVHENEVSCCYCDLKISAFNEPIFRFGRRFSGFMEIWFTIGLGFGIASLFLVTAVLLLQVYPTVLSDRLTASLFGFSPSMRISLSEVAHVFVSTVITVSAHELGHALAAASEGIQMEFIAVFVAAIFPGGLVAFDHDVLQSLPSFNALRIYCAGIWHNAMFCALCALTLFILPGMLSPFYTHGGSLVVVEVPSTSPLSRYLTPGDVIMTLDGIRVHTPSEWLELTSLLDKRNSETSNVSLYLEGSRRFRHRKGYCVPISMIEEGFKAQFVENQLVCPTDLTAFVPLTCLNKEATLLHNINQEDQPDLKPVAFCLDAKEIIKLSKCGDEWVTLDTDKSNCICSEGESCLHAVQSPGLSWTEITFRRTSLKECSKFDKDMNLDFNSSKSLEHKCLGTFVFLGDLIAMAHSIQLTAYQPRWLFNFGKFLPYVLEKSLICTFNVSLALILLNSLPVYYLDGECILEASLHYFTWLSPRKKKKALQVCLIGGTLLSVLAFVRIFLISLR